MKFGSLKYLPAQQGQLDGFCGIYTIVNFISRRQNIKPESNAQKILFRRILNILKDQGRLSPSRICDGFRDGQLQKAFNRISQERDLRVKARSLSSFAKQKSAENVLDLLRSLQADEAAMVHMDKYDHWVLAHSVKGETFFVDDSASEPNPVSMSLTVAKKAKIVLKTGLVFLNSSNALER